MTRRRIVFALAGVMLAMVGLFAWRWATYPSDRTPEGAYLRVMTAVNQGKPEACFAYLETEAQHASYTLRDYRRKSRARVLASYPEPERSRLAETYRAEAEAADGSDLFAIEARRRGWLARLRRDLSGIAKVEIHGERATVETVRGTRYPFRRRDNGIWGLTSFTAALVADAEKAARDDALIQRAADDYDRVKSSKAQ
ncbi:MAG: hypothetical protein OZ921_02165 [Sorangiineae bacterium]|nr:hypothetical protein [Polyangiaceae bacterium]MEB2321290.1 hypothetical protein [Sorangiineae bacterium]